MPAAPNLIVGTGPTALAAALALKRLGVPFEVADLAYDLDAGRQAVIHRLGAAPPSAWDPADVETVFPPARSSARKGVERRLSFGSDFPYRRPDYLALVADECEVEVSHGLGGFGNVWGAAILPYAKQDLKDWPLSTRDLEDSYRNISRFVPVSGERDALEANFPMPQGAVGAITRSEQTARILRVLNRKGAALERHGITFGRARLAVDATGGPTACRYCGHCLEGCPYGAMFNPRGWWGELERSGVVVHRGFYALEFREDEEGVTLAAIDSRDESIRRWKPRRLFLALGTMGSTRLLARSLDLHAKPIRLKDSQYFFFPLLSYAGAADTTVRFTLAEVFMEILNPRVSPHHVHFQVYGLNHLFRRTIEAMLPAPLRLPSLLKSIERRFYLFQGFLHSSESAELEFTLESSRPRADAVRVRARENPAARRVARRAQALLRARLATFGLIPPLYLAMVPPGRSFHLGGSFPMGGKDAACFSDLLGRPAGLARVHILDAATFPSIPAPTITYTAMANADRIVRETYRSGQLA